MVSINYLTRIEFGKEAIRLLPKLVEELGLARPMVISDAGLSASGLLRSVCGHLDRPYSLFTETPGNPDEAAVMAGLTAFRDADADGIIAVGGGSSIDLAKAVRLLATHEGPLTQYALVEGGNARIRAGMCPMIAVPTTAGTGSEVGRGAVIITSEGRKLGIVSPHIIPSVAICDPDLTVGLPPGLTAATGMDAISHCLETYMSPVVNPPADAIALDGLKRGLLALEAAVRDGANLDARSDMMMCALEGALAFQKGLGAVHSLSHGLGAIQHLNLHHGMLNAILMPAVLRFNRVSVGGKWAVLTDILGGKPDQVIQELCDRIGLDRKLDALGLTDDMKQDVAGKALGDHCHATNPRLPTRDEYYRLLLEAS